MKLKNYLSAIFLCIITLILNSPSYSQEQAILQINNRLLDKTVPDTIYGANFFERQSEAIYSRLRNAPVTGNYIIGPGDTFQIRLTGLTNEEFQVPVENNGTIAFGNISPKNVNGMLLSEVKKLLIDNVEDIYKNVTINISLLELKSIEVFLQGYFNNPGIYVVPGNAQLIDLITLGGGLTSAGNYRAVEYLSTNGEKATIDLYRYFESGKVENFQFRSGDRINIPPVESSFTIFGQIYNPARYQFVDNFDLENAIHLAGGTTPSANIEYVQVSRRTELNGYDFYQINLPKLGQEKFELENGDIVYIPSKNEILKENNVFVTISGRVEFPGEYVLPKGSRLNDLLEMAGGLKEDGFLNGIVLRRPSLQGEETRLRQNFFQPIEQKLLEIQSRFAENAILQDQQKYLLIAQQFRQQILDSLGENTDSGRILFDPENEDPVLDDLDRVVIPSEPNTVLIMGAVFTSGSIIHHEGWTIDDYLNHVGGITMLGNKDEMFLVKPYGYVQNINQTQIQIEPGDVIVIPPKVELFELSPEQFQN